MTNEANEKASTAPQAPSLRKFLPPASCLLQLPARLDCLGQHQYVQSRCARFGVIHPGDPFTAFRPVTSGPVCQSAPARWRDLASLPWQWTTGCSE